MEHKMKAHNSFAKLPFTWLVTTEKKSGHGKLWLIEIYSAMESSYMKKNMD